MEGIRLNKYLSEAGYCSRREADRLIEEGKVFVDGNRAIMGMRVDDTNLIRVNGKTISNKEKPVIIALNKPRGIVCTAQKKEKDNIIDFVNYKTRIYPVGRLDKESEGLILLTNMGDLVNKIMRAGNYHEKEYIVTVDKVITKEFLKKMSEGVPILDTVTRKCKVEKIDDYCFRIILTQGLNRQIRRMCEHFNYNVKKLVRVRIMNIKLGDLPVGKYRELTSGELEKLTELTKNSSSETIKYRGVKYAVKD